MRVLCPACGAIYDVPDRLIGEGRRLRCAKCGHDWMVRPAGAAMPAPAAPVPELAPGRRKPPRTASPIDPPLPRLGDEPPRSRVLRWLAWVASVLVVMLLLAGLWLFRTELMLAWPATMRLYQLFGATLP